MLKIKKQRMEDLYHETLSECIGFCGKENISLIGKKMYIRLRNNFIVSAEFAGTETAYNSLVLLACNKSGILDQNVTPFRMIFKKSKSENGQDKLVSVKMVLNETGEYTFIWNSEMAEDDLMAINQHVIKYIELFSSL